MVQRSEPRCLRARLRDRPNTHDRRKKAGTSRATFDRLGYRAAHFAGSSPATSRPSLSELLTAAAEDASRRLRICHVFQACIGRHRRAHRDGFCCWAPTWERARPASLFCPSARKGERARRAAAPSSLGNGCSTATARGHAARPRRAHSGTGAAFLASAKSTSRLRRERFVLTGSSSKARRSRASAEERPSPSLRRRLVRLRRESVGHVDRSRERHSVSQD
jgi:hypothetical protein